MPLGDRLHRRAVEALSGRRAELERLERFALGEEPLVLHIQGIPGIGKTHLLNALAASIGGKGVFVVRVDARWCEPSPAALCRAILREIGASESEDPAVVAAGLSEGAKRTLLVLDSYDVTLQRLSQIRAKGTRAIWASCGLVDECRNECTIQFWLTNSALGFGL